MRIREYRDKDYKQVSKVWERCFSKLRPIDSRVTMKRVLKRAPGMFLVAEEDGRIVGSVYATYDGRQAVIHRLSVLPENQKTGIARRLMSTLIPRIKKLRPIEILTHSSPEKHVVRLYEELGLRRQKAVYLKKVY